MVGNFSCRLEGHTVSFSVKLKSLSFFCMGCSIEIRVQVFFLPWNWREWLCGVWCPRVSGLQAVITLAEERFGLARDSVLHRIFFLSFCWLSRYLNLVETDVVFTFSLLPVISAEWRESWWTEEVWAGFWLGLCSIPWFAIGTQNPCGCDSTLCWAVWPEEGRRRCGDAFVTGFSPLVSEDHLPCPCLHH